MNIGQVIQKVKDLIAAAKAGNYFAAVAILLEILRAITDSMPQTAFNAPMKMQGSSLDCNAATEAELLAELDKLSTRTMATDATPSAAPTGPVIDLLKPVLLALLKKWLGF